MAVLTPAISAQKPTFGFMPGDVDEAASLAPLDADELRRWGVEP